MGKLHKEIDTVFDMSCVHGGLPQALFIKANFWNCSFPGCGIVSRNGYEGCMFEVRLDQVRSFAI